MGGERSRRRAQYWRLERAWRHLRSNGVAEPTQASTDCAHKNFDTQATTADQGEADD